MLFADRPQDQESICVNDTSPTVCVGLLARHAASSVHGRSDLAPLDRHLRMGVRIQPNHDESHVVRVEIGTNNCTNAVVLVSLLAKAVNQARNEHALILL